MIAHIRTVTLALQAEKAKRRSAFVYRKRNVLQQPVSHPH
jgi:hypothetical protein